MIEVLKKGQKLLMPMARLALRDDRPVEHIERGEQGGGTVSIVIVGHPFKVAQPDRQHWLGSLECLDLTLLVHAQAPALLVRRIEIEPDHVAHLLDEEGVGGP